MNSKDSVKQVRNWNHYPDCPWANPNATCGPDNCGCGRRRQRSIDLTSSHCQSFSGTSDTGSDNSNTSIKCVNCRYHVVINILEEVLNSVLRLCNILIDKCK